LIRRLLRPAVAVGLLVGLAIGLGAGFGYGGNFDAGFRAALVGALVGGALAVVGGYLGSKELIDRDDRRERQDLIGAVQVTRSEMSTNSAMLDHLKERRFLRFAEVHLYDADYRQVITTLARGLPMDLFSEVSVTANRLRHAAILLGQDQERAGADIRGETIGELTALAGDLNRVNAKLLRYTEDELKLHVPEKPENPF